MTQHEKEALSERRRLNRTTSDVSTVRSHDHEASTSFIPRRSPRVELQQRELQLEKLRIAKRDRRSLMSENPKQEILEKRREAYAMRRLKAGVSANNEHRAGPSSVSASMKCDKVPMSRPCRSPQITEASPKRKGKSIAHDNQKRNCTNSYIPDRNTLERIVTRCNVTDQFITRQSPRLLEQVQLQDELTAEESQKRKGKAVAPYQKRRRANSYIPGGNSPKGIVIGSTNGEENNNDPMDYDTDDEGGHYEINTSDDHDEADDDNRISRPVRLHDHEAEAHDVSSNLNVQDIPEYQIG